MSKLPLTIVTAVLNEESLLPGFLEHARTIADEIIVVIDYRNTDKSAEIANKFGCKVLSDTGQSEGIVFNNKNWGADEAKHDWILILDADERLDNTLLSEISMVVNGKANNKASIFQTSFINYEFGKLFTKCNQKEKPFIRLFKKGSFRYNTGKTAEGFGIQTSGITKSKLDRFIVKIPLVRSWYLSRNPSIWTFKGHLVHYSHPTIIEFVRKIDHYSTREGKILFSRNPNISNFSLFVRLLFAPLKEFIYKYFIWKFYKEGLHGYIASILYAFYYFLINAKYFRYVYESKHQKQIINFKRKYNFPDTI